MVMEHSGAPLRGPRTDAVDMGRAALRDRLAASVRRLLGYVEKECDCEVFETMLSLYQVAPGRVFEEVIEPWMRSRAHRLQLVYGEHRALPGDTHLLGCPEALLVLERLDRDRARLAATWPHATADLAAVEDAWGVRLFG